MMFDPEANANAARARMRQQQYMRLALLLCMTMLLMDGSGNHNRQRTAGKSSGSLRGSDKAELEFASINPRYEVLLESADAKSLNGLLVPQFDTSKNKKSKEHNVTGIYRGSWAHSLTGNISLSGSSTSAKGSENIIEINPTENGNSLIQLRSVPIHGVPNVKYVYGILKLYGVPGTMSGIRSVDGNGVSEKTLSSLNISADIVPSSSSRNPKPSSGGSYSSRLQALKNSLNGVRAQKDITYPVQGIHVPATSECVLVITPSRSHRVYIGVESPAKNVMKNKPQANSSLTNSAKGTLNSQLDEGNVVLVPPPAPLNPDGTIRGGLQQQARSRAHANQIDNHKLKRQMLKQGDDSLTQSRLQSSLSHDSLVRLGLHGKRRHGARQHRFNHGRKLESDETQVHDIADLDEDLDSERVTAKDFPDLLYSILVYVWPMPFSLVNSDFIFTRKLERDDFYAGVDFSWNLFQDLYDWTLDTEVVGQIREALGARSRGSTSLFTLLRSIDAKDNMILPLMPSDSDSHSHDENEEVVKNNDKEIDLDHGVIFEEEGELVSHNNFLPNDVSQEGFLSHHRRLQAGAGMADAIYPEKSENKVLRLHKRENNLFALHHHMYMLPTDSFMKAVKKKAVMESQLLNVLSAIPGGNQKLNTRPVPFFYAERYPIATVGGLELLLVDVDRSGRSQQIPHQFRSESNISTPKKGSTDDEKSKNEKRVPPSSIPGGLGAATVSNSFLSFLASSGSSSQWLDSLKCTFAIRLNMGAGSDPSKSIWNMVPGLHTKRSDAVGGNKSTNTLDELYPPSTLQRSLYEKHTKRGNDIRELQGTMIGKVESSPCSYPICSGEGLSKFARELHADSSPKDYFDHEEFSVVASFYKINFEALESKLSLYTFVYSIVCLFQAYLLVLQMMASSNPAAASRISILSISAMAVLDAAICILHLLLSSVVSGSAFYCFLWISFMKLIVFCVLEMRFVIAIYQARHSQEIAENGWSGLRNHLASLHARFYGALFLVILLVDWYYTRPLILVFVLYSFWIPQIGYSAYVGGHVPSLSLSFSLSMTLTRLFFPLYTLACPENFLSMLSEKFTVSYISAEATVVWLGLQLGVVFLQHKYGVRFFVPEYFLPVRYNYSRSVSHLFEGSTESQTESRKECVICYNTIEGIEQGSRDYMVTPCDHLFHRECLSQWLDVKMECPVCRAALPIDES